MKTIFKVSLLGAVFGSLLCLVYFYILFKLGFNPFGKNKYLYIGLYASAFIFSMWYYRDKLNAKLLSVLEGLSIGFILNIAACFLVFLSIYIFLEWTHSGLQILDLYKSEAIQLLDRTKNAVTDETELLRFDELYESIQKMTSWHLSIDVFIGFFLTGAFHTFVFMLIFKNIKK